MLRGGQVRCPQGVPPAVFGLEQGELRAGVRPLAAGEDPHRRGPAGQLVPAPVPEQRGQLGDVRFLDPAPPVRAPGARAGAVGAALADLAAVIDGDLPRAGRDLRDRCLLPLAELPARGVGQLVPGPGGGASRRAISAWLAPAPSQVTISRRRHAGGTAAIASSGTRI